MSELSVVDQREDLAGVVREKLVGRAKEHLPLIMYTDPLNVYNVQRRQEVHLFLQARRCRVHQEVRLGLPEDCLMRAHA